MVYTKVCSMCIHNKNYKIGVAFFCVFCFVSWRLQDCEVYSGSVHRGTFVYWGGHSLLGSRPVLGLGSSSNVIVF